MPAPKPLNVLWISFEDTSPRFGCYGDPLARTPHVDRLVREGCCYPNAFSTAGVCAPSRAAVITGMYATSIGAQHQRTTHTNPSTPELPTPYDCVPPHYVKCFPEYLRAAGYYCTNNEKTDYQFTPPFTAWDECGPEGHWRKRPKGRPFFAVFNLMATHESGMWQDKGTPQTDPAKVKLPPYLPDTREGRKALARQYDHIAGNDQRVGELLKQLEADGLAENTAVFIWSDHGEGLPRSKRWPYDTGIRVPLIVKWPGVIEPGTVCPDLVSMIDLGPTVLSMLGVEIPAHLQGQAFLGARQEEPREYIFATRDRYDEAYDMVRAVRDAKYKYIRNYYPALPRQLWIPYSNRHPILQEIYRLHLSGKLKKEQRWMLETARPAEELYDLETDPWERNNVAGNPAYREELERLRGVLDAWRIVTKDLGDISEADQVRSWYPDGRMPRTAAPLFAPIAGEQQFPGAEAKNRGGRFKGPILLQLHCATQGASIGYTFAPDRHGPWQLYCAPLLLKRGTHTLRTKAIRIGYEESKEREATFVVT